MKFHYCLLKILKNQNVADGQTDMKTVYLQQTQFAAGVIKNILFVEAVKNISAKFQLYPPYGLWGDDFWIFFLKFSLLVAMATNKMQVMTKMICLIEDYSRNISVKYLSEYLQ